MLDLVGKHIKLTQFGELVAQGKVVNAKITHPLCDTVHLISFDNEYFFNLYAKGIGVEVSTIPYPDEEVNVFGYYIMEWQDYHKNPTNLIYREHSIHELDEEVEDLVRVLNECEDIQTTGSCSGHLRHKLWVSIMCRTFEGLKKLTDFFNNQQEFSQDWVVRTDRLLRAPEDKVHLLLECNHVGNKAYYLAQRLAYYIECKGDLIYNE